MPRITKEQLLEENARLKSEKSDAIAQLWAMVRAINKAVNGSYSDDGMTVEDALIAIGELNGVIKHTHTILRDAEQTKKMAIERTKQNQVERENLLRLGATL